MTYNIVMGEGAPGFAEWLFQQFIAWERHQPGKRSSYTAFARWLSDNPYGVELSQQNVSNWIAGKYVPSDKYVWVLAEKLGQDVLQFFGNIELPDVLLSYVISRWSTLPEDVQHEIHDMVEKYLGDDNEAASQKKGNTLADHR